MSQAWSVLRSVVREKSGDTDSSNYITSDPNTLILWNDLYARLQQMFPRTRMLTSTQTGIVSVVGQFYFDTTLKTIRKILRLWQVGGASAITPVLNGELEKVEPWEIFVCLNENSVAAQPTKWAYIDLGTDTGASVGFKRIYFHPVPVAIKNYAALAEIEAAAITADADVPDLTEGEAYGLTSLLAARLAKSMGQPQDFVDDLLREVPDSMAASLGVRKDRSSPRERPSEAQV